MAFPGTYDINYYKGDTFEFRVFPKDSAGAVFSLADYAEGIAADPVSASVHFTIAPSRGTLDDPTDAIAGYIAISSDSTYLQCAITPTNGAELTAGTAYVYDIKIARTSSPYPLDFTLLTGTISVTDDVIEP